MSSPAPACSAGWLALPGVSSSNACQAQLAARLFGDARAAVAAADAALTPGELAIAERVHTGPMPCELGATVVLEADAKAPGYFNLRGKGFNYRVHPVETSTGAVRLEDQHAGAVWLQLSNKSMLMDHKAGRRLADECATPAQVAVAEALKKNPAPNLLEAPVVAK